MINDLWYKNSIVYCLSVGTFMDSNGDGVGDFQGLARRLDYLQGLGVTTLWLMPFQTSPGRDDGYDVADYYNVDPSFGTLGDFVEFTHGASQRGMRVLIDLVVNHTSDQHPWFLAARADAASKYRDWYVWADRKPAHADDGVVFPGVQKSTWSFDKVARRWYFHRFYEFQPDLNTANPLVQAEILKIMLEVHDPKNCAAFLAEPPEVGGGILDYSTERCAVDRKRDPTMAACGSRGTGTRVYDIRDPLHPAEIAYWKGPAPRTAFLPGSGSWAPGVDRTVEKQAGLARFVRVRSPDGKGHEINLWIVGDAGGFQVLRFTEEFLRTQTGKAVRDEALKESDE